MPERALRCYTQHWHWSASAGLPAGTAVLSADQCRPAGRHCSAQCRPVPACRPALQCPVPPVPPSTSPRRSKIGSKSLQEGSRWATCGAKSSNVYVEGSFELLGKINGEKTCLWVLLAHYVTVQCRPVLAWRPALQCPVPASAQCRPVPASRPCCSAQCRPSGPNWPPVPSAQWHCLRRGTANPTPGVSARGCD